MKIVGPQRKTLNALLWEYLSIRDDNRCVVQPCNETVLHMAHIYPKGTNTGMSYEPKNVRLLCWKHHGEEATNYKQAKRWMEIKYPERMKRLKLMARKPIKITYQQAK